MDFMREIAENSLNLLEPPRLHVIVYFFVYND